MYFSTVVIALAGASTAFAAALPALSARQLPVCTGTDSNAVCCATDVLGVADLNCNPPPSTPTDSTDFVNICAAIGQQAKCCLLPILGQALVCQDVVATS